MGAATKIVMQRQPTTPCGSGDDYLIPSVLLQDGSSLTDTNNTSTVTAAWVTDTGSGTAAGTFSVAATAGRAVFHDLTVTSAAGCTGHWHFTDGALTATDSASVTITPHVTATKLAMDQRTMIDGNSGVIIYYRVPRSQNLTAATGKTFDFRIAIAAQNGSGVRDTTYTGLVTATVTVGTCTLGGTTSRNAVAGIADFSDLYPATGTGSLAITFSASGLTSFTTDTMTVITPPSPVTYYGQSVELPRQTVDTTYPSSFSKDYIVDAGAVADGVTTFNTWQAAANRICTVDNPSTDVRVKVAAGTYIETLQLPAKAATTGLICFEPATGIPGTAGQRVTPAQVLAAGVVLKSTDWAATIACDPTAHHYRFSGFELTKVWTLTTDLHNAVVSLANATVRYTNPMTVLDCPHHIGFDRCYIHGEANKTLKKGVQNEGRHNFVTNCYIDEVHATRSPDQGSGDENALFSVFAYGPALYDNNRLRATGEVMIFGGGDPTFYDLRPSDITFTRNYCESPVAWQTLYKFKNSLESKTVRRLRVEGNIFDGAWNGNQDGMGIKFGAGNQSGEVIYNFEGNSDILFRYNFCRTMQGFLSLSGDIFQYAAPDTRMAVMHNVAVNIDDPTTWVTTSGTRNSASEINRAMFIAIGNSTGITQTVVGHNTIIGTPDVTATSTRALLLDGVSHGTYYRDNITIGRAYAVSYNGGGQGTAATSVGLPDDTFAGNVFYEFDTANYGGVAFPANTARLAAYANVGFAGTSPIGASRATANPDTLLADLIVSGTYATYATDGTASGADISAVRAAIAGVWDGTATPAAADHLAMSVQPAGAVSGVALTTQPVVLVKDSSGSTVSGDTSTVTASWVSLTGDASPSGTLTKAAVSGVATFTTLALTWTVPSTGYWHFTDGSLTSVNSSTLTLTVTVTPPPDDTNPFGIVPGAPAVYRMARGKAVFGGFRRTLRALWRWLTLSHSLA